MFVRDFLKFDVYIFSGNCIIQIYYCIFLIYLIMDGRGNVHFYVLENFIPRPTNWNLGFFFARKTVSTAYLYVNGD